MAISDLPAASPAPSIRSALMDVSGSANPEVTPAEMVGRGDKIIVAAFQQISENGLDGLTIRTVLARSGVNRRSFYERFSSKDDLVLAVFTKSVQTAADECGEAAETLRDPIETLRFMVRHLVTAGKMSSNRNIGVALCREHIRLAANRPNDLQIALQPLIVAFSGQLAAGMRSGQVRRFDPDRLAHFVYNLVWTSANAGILYDETDQFGQPEGGQFADDLWDFCRRAIVP